MLDMDDFDLPGPSPIVPCLSVRITKTEEQMSVIMQRYTAYVIQVNDFGKVKEVPKRFSDFETLHKDLLRECDGLHLPPLPPKGVDGTDASVVAARKVDLEKILRSMLASPEVLMDKSLSLCKFLELGNPSIILARFVMVPRSRGSLLKTIVKLNDAKYKDDVFRLGHPSVSDLLLEGLRELRKGTADTGHWSTQAGGRNALCQIVATTLGASQEAREKLLDAEVVSSLLGLVELEEAALDDARIALNVIVAHEGDRLASIVATFLQRGGSGQLDVIVSRPKCQEFVAKLLWLAWDKSTRAAFAQPGGQGLRLLQALLRSSSQSCAVLAAVLLAGMVAGGNFDSEPSHRQEAIRMVHSVLDRPEASLDAQFGKTLSGGNLSLIRLAAMLEDTELAPMILGLLCTAKPPASKLAQISGNLAALVGGKGSTIHTEQTKARAAELLLHIQSAGPTTTTATPISQAGTGGYGNSSLSSPLQVGMTQTNGPATPSAASSSALLELLERCEGIVAHEESMESALRSQLSAGIAKGHEALEMRSTAVRSACQLAAHRLQALPNLSFASFDQALSSFKTSREALSVNVRDCESLHTTLERQLNDLQSARPSHVDPNVYKEKLLTAERLHREVTSQREALEASTRDAREAQRRAEAASSELRKLVATAKALEAELATLRQQKAEKDSQAAQLRQKAYAPGHSEMKAQVAENIERNLAQAKELQVIGQRVQQGDPDYLKDGESRDMKINELAQKLAALKRQHQTLLQQQKDLDFDPEALAEKASRIETEAETLAIRIGSLEAQHLDAETGRVQKAGEASRATEEARMAEDRRGQAASRLSAVESEAKAHLSVLQPMIQAHNAGWQKLLSQQKKLDSDQLSLEGRLLDVETAARSEALNREKLVSSIHDVVSSLLALESFLTQLKEDPLPVATVPAQTPDLSAATQVNDVIPSTALPVQKAQEIDFTEDWGEADVKAVFQPPSAHVEEAPVSSTAPVTASAIDDDFDAFLKEDLDVNFAGFGDTTGSAKAAPVDVDDL